jgi:MFS family permease
MELLIEKCLFRLSRIWKNHAMTAWLFYPIAPDYLFLTMWFEMGTSFSLPAMGALSDRIKERFDVTDEGIGQLTSAYFFAAMVGPLAGGVCMDKFGPGITVILANIIVTLGALFQAVANGPDQFWLVLIGRLMLGFGGTYVRIYILVINGAWA